jgi:hypothetical protein
LKPKDLSRLQPALDRQTLRDSKRASLEATITPDLADRLGKSYILGRYTSPEIAASAAVAGITSLEDLHMNVATQLLKQGVVPKQESTNNPFASAKPGETVTYTDPKTGRPITVRIQSPRPIAAFTQGGAKDETTGVFAPGTPATGLRKRTEAEILAGEKAQRRLAPKTPVFDATNNALAQTRLPANMQTATTAGELVALPFQIAGAYFGATGSVISMMAPDQLEPVAEGFRSAIRTVVVAGMLPGETLYNTARLTLRDASVIGQKDLNPWEKFLQANNPGRFINNLGASLVSSTAVTALTDLASGDLDLGKGYLAGGKTGERALELQADMAGTRAEARGIDLSKVYTTPEEKAFLSETFDSGFLAGEFLVDAKLTTRDSELYQFFEDAVNVGGRIGLDPGLYGFDIVDIGLKALVNRFGVSNQVAKSYMTAKQSGNYEEALRIAAENGMDAEKANLLTESERLVKLADDIVNPKENVVYSGDRTFNATDEVTKFRDVDDPDFTPNANNLYGEGLYVTDSVYTASSTGYNVDDVVPLSDVEGPSYEGRSMADVITESGLVPEEVNLSKVGFNPEGGTAGVWKFDKTDLNILDTNTLATEIPEVAQSLSGAAQKVVDDASFNTDKYNPEALYELTFIDTSVMFPLERANDSRVFYSIRQYVQEEIDSKGLFSIGSTAKGGYTEFRTVEEYITYLKNTPQYARHLQRTESLRSLLTSKFGFDEEVASVYAQHIMEIVSNSIRKSAEPLNSLRFEIESARTFGPNGTISVGELFQNLYKQIEKLRTRNYVPAFDDFQRNMFQALVDIGYRYTENVSDVVNINDAFKNFFNSPNPTGMANEILDEALKFFYDEPTRLAILEDIANPGQVLPMLKGLKAIGKTNPMTQAMVDAGYDGMRYNGGKLVGGTGDHNAYVVWKPSKLAHVDTMSGEKFPMNQIAQNLADANRYGYEADYIDTLRQTQDGWKEGMGLIGMDPETVQITRLENMKINTHGRKILQAMADEKSVVKIWRTFLKGKSPGAAILLAKASTIDEVFEVLRQVVDSGDPNVNLRNLPNGWKDWFSDTGYMVKQQADRYIKQSAMMPQSTYVSFDDPVAALQNTDRLLQVVGVKIAERDSVLEVLFKAIEENTSVAWDDFFAAANEATLTKKMTEAGWTPEQIKEFTSYRRKGDDITRWTLEDLADDIPIEWFDEGDGPLRITQLLTGGGWLLEPEVIDDLIRDLNPVIKGLRKLSKDNPDVAKTIDVQRTIAKAIEHGSSAWVKPAALGAPLPFRYILRVVPELTARVAFSGEFNNFGDYMAQIFTGHLNYDTFGRTIRSSKEVADELAVLTQLKDEYADLTNPANSAAATAKTQRRIANIEKKYGTQAEIQVRIDQLTLQIDNNLPGDQRTLANNVRGHLEGTNDPDVLASQLQRSKSQSVVTNKVNDPLNITKKEKEMRRSWVTAQAQDIAEMAANKDYRVIAEALLAGDPAMLERIAQDLFSGELLGTYEAYTKNVFNIKPDWDWNTIEAARSRVNEIVTDIKQRTAMHPDVLEALSKDLHNGKSLSDPVMDKVYKASDSFTQLVRDVLLDNPDAPPQVPYNALVPSTPNAERNANFMYKSFGLYTKAAAGMARNPLWAQAYWKRVIEMMSAMDANEAAAMVAANVDKLPDYVIEKLQDAAPSAKGTLDRNEVSRIAEVHAREVVDNLLYNPNQISYIQYRHPLFFMFFDAYREQWMTWLKLMKNPTNIHKVDVAARSLQSFREPFSEEDNTILHNDPTTQKQVVTVPGSRWMLGLAGGDANFAIPTRNLSVVGSPAPGVGFVVNILAQSWNPSSETFANLKQTFAPFAGVNASIDLRNYFVPKFLQLTASGIAGKGKQYLPSLDVVWGNLEKVAGGDIEKAKKASAIHIMRQLATQVDKYPKTPEGRKQLVEDVDSLSDNFAIAHGFARAFLPGAPITQFYVDTKQGNILQGLLLDEIRTTQNEVYAKGGNLSQAVSALFEKWGNGIWAFFGSGSETNIPGLQPTKEFQSWVFKNKGVLDKYPMAGGYLGPQLGEYNSRIFIQQSMLGQRSQKDPKISLEDAANVFAEAYYDRQISTIPPEYEGTAEARKFIDDLKTETETRFPTWSPLLSVGEYQIKGRLQMQEIRKMINDPKIVDTPAGYTLREYMGIRDNAIQQMIDYDSSITARNWNSVEASYSLRQYLFNEGNRLSAEVPEFGPLWQNILKREFETKDILPTVEASK